MPAPEFTYDYDEPEIATSGSPGIPKEKPTDITDKFVGAPQLTGNYDIPDTRIDTDKLIDVLPMSDMSGIPVSELYESHKEVKDVIDRKKDQGMIRGIEAALNVGRANLRQADIGWAMLLGNDDPNFDFELAKIDREIQYESQYMSDDSLVRKIGEAAAGLAPMAWETGVEGIEGGLVTAMLLGGGTLMVAPPAAPAATVAGFTSGTAAFGAKRITEIEAGSMFIKLRNLRDENGNPVDPRLVKTFSLAVGAVNGALEAAQIKVLLKTIPGFDKVMKDVVDKAVVKLLKDGSVSKFLLASAGRYAKFLGAETAIELAQETNSMVFGEITKIVHEYAEDAGIERITMDEVLETWKETAFASMAGFGVLGAPGHSIHTMSGLIDHRSQVKNQQLASLLPDDTNSDYEQETKNTFERVKNLFLGNRDERVIVNKNEGRILNEELAGLVEENQTSAELAVAVQLYIDSKNNPEAVEAALIDETFEPTEVAEEDVLDFEEDEVPSFLKKKAGGLPTEEGVVGEEMDLEGEIPSFIKKKAGAEVVRTPEEEAEVQRIIAEESAEKGEPVAIEDQGILLDGKVPDVDITEQVIVPEKETEGETYVSKKGNIYTKEDGKWYDAKGEEVTHEHRLRALDRGFEAKEKARAKKRVTVPLTETHKRLIEMSKTLTKKQIAFADKISELYKTIGQEALGDEVIFNTMNNYVSRSWISDKKTRDIISRLTQTTVHAKERRLPTIVEGWTEGLTMRTHSAVDNLTLYRDNIIRTIEQKRFIKLLKEGKTEEGNPVFSVERLAGYERVKMPRYTPSKGTTYFAPRDVARKVNNIFGVSAFDESQIVQSLTKLNALLKKIALSTSLFHNIAFMRSFYLGGKSVQWENINFFTAHREGVEMIHNMDETVRLGVRNGLTLNLIQDWEEEILVMGNDIERITNEYTGSKRIRGFVSDLWKRQVEFTFGVQGAGLKIKAFAYELQNERIKNPNENIDKTAARVASLMNDDFGGLHLERLEVNPTFQHIFRLVALAPDWTRSNIRTVTGMFRRAEKGGYAEQRQLYRRFWSRVVLKSLGATAMMNILLAGGDVGEAWDRYKAGVEEDWKNVVSVDITGLWHLFGKDPQDRKYFSISGHFLDPIKYSQLLVGEPKILQYKASILMRVITDWLFNENWRGKRFKNLAEIPMDVGEFAEYFDPDTYVTYAPEKRDAPFLETNFTFLAILIHSVIGSSPIAFQNLLAIISGEQDVLTGISNTLGIRQPRRRKKRGWK